jgi:hypothetical protein
MKEFEDHLVVYNQNHPHQYFSDIPEEEWGDVAAARTFLEKYWLNQDEYESIYVPILRKIFDINHFPPARNFHNDFHCFTVRGGALFGDFDFPWFIDCLNHVNEKNFIVIQNIYQYPCKEPAFRMKFPIDITYDELYSGNYISGVLIDMLCYDYFIFGETSTWGMYVARCFDDTVLIGCRLDVLDRFKTKYASDLTNEDFMKSW